MELFKTDTQIFSGECCGCEYIHDPDNRMERDYLTENPGIRLNFVKPFEEEEGFINHVLETGKGNLHFQLRMKYDPSNKGKRYPDDVIRSYYDNQHPKGWMHTCGLDGETIDNGIYHAATYHNCSTAKPGDILILVETTHSNLKEPTSKNRVGFKYLFCSDPFYNWIHSERNYPSLRLVVLEKL